MGRWAVSQKPKLLIRYKCFPFVLFSVTGCLNGGGQIRPGDGETSKELLSRLDELYNSLRYQLLVVFSFVIAFIFSWPFKLQQLLPAVIEYAGGSLTRLGQNRF